MTDTPLPADNETAGLGGRPEHKPNGQERALVTLMAGMGAREVDIASVIGIAQKTLRKHYEDELLNGRAKMDAHVFKALYKGIEKGKTDLIKLYLERKVPGWKPDAPDPGAGVNVAVHLTLSDMIRQISSSPKPKGDFSRLKAERAAEGLTIEHNPTEKTP